MSFNIHELIYTVRGVQVMLDSDLAVLYGVETKVFNQAVKRNLERFPLEFRFQLTQIEFDNLRSQTVTSREFACLRYIPHVNTKLHTTVNSSGVQFE